MIPQGTPHIDNSGTIVIPFNADPKYQYWNGGQPLLETLLELKAPEDIWRKHTERQYPGKYGARLGCGLGKKIKRPNARFTGAKALISERKSQIAFAGEKHHA